jgi:diguanylate cyclase (GGDEF)-like protein
LTYLPGNPAIEQRFEELMEKGESFALGYLDIDNFKAYNDYYGFTQGDKIIQFVAQSLVAIVNKAGLNGDFVGHIGGDDFIFLSHVENAEIIASATVQWIKNAAPELYTHEDRKRGGIMGKDRDGNHKLFGFIGVSIAIVFSAKDLKTFSEYSSLAAKIKKALKNSGGSNYADRSILDG